MSFNFVPGKKVEVPGINFKNSITVPTGKTILLIVDMQNDFVKEGGSLVVPAAKGTVSNIRKLIASARKSKVKVAYTQDTHYDNDLEWKIWPKHCKINSWGWQIIDELKPKQDEIVFQKNRYDGFYGTSLEHYMNNVWKVNNIIITGTVSNICVAHTAASAGLRWYNIIVPADGISALTEFDQALTLRQVTSLYSGIATKSYKNIHFKNELKTHH